MNQYQETTTEDWIKTIIYIVVSVAIVILGAIFLLLAYCYIWIILVIRNLFLLMKWHAKNFAYRCPKFGHEFEISTFTDFISPQGQS